MHAAMDQDELRLIRSRLNGVRPLGPWLRDQSSESRTECVIKLANSGLEIICRVAPEIPNFAKARDLRALTDFVLSTRDDISGLLQERSRLINANRNLGGEEEEVD